MKKCLFFILLFVCGYSTLSATGFSFSSIKNWTGEGSKKTALVIQWRDTNVDPAAIRPLVWGYRFDGNKSGEDMLRDILKSDSRLYALFFSSPMSTVMGGIGYDIDNNGKVGVSVGDKNLTGEVGIFPASGYGDFDIAMPIDKPDYWFGGWFSKGYCSYWSADTQTDGTPNEFSYAMQGMADFQLVDGDWHAWTFSMLGSEDDNVPPVIELFSPADESSPAKEFVAEIADVKIYTENGNIVIRQSSLEYQDIQIYSTSGVLLLTASIDGNSVIPFQKSGIYCVRLLSRSKPQITQMIHLK